MKVSTGARIASMQRQIEQLDKARIDAIKAYERVSASHQNILMALKDVSDALLGRSMPDVLHMIDKIRAGAIPMFTQQHYIAVAALVKGARIDARAHPAGPERDARMGQISQMQLAFIKKFEADNPKFNKLIFIGACGEQPE